MSPVHVWRAERDPKTRYLVHTVRSGGGHALIAPLTTYAFGVLGVPAAIWEHGQDWFPIYTAPSVLDFELQHAREDDRGHYNSRLFESVLRRRAPEWGEHAGFHDLFVPIVVEGGVVAVLVTGPVAFSRPTAAQVLERWFALTERPGHPTDPEFSRYLSLTLSTLVLDGEHAGAFERMVGCLTRLMQGEEPSANIANQWEIERTELERVRLVERTWETVHAMVDERSARGWTSATRAYGLSQLGLPRLPDTVLVALSASRGDRDPVDAVIQRDAFQRDAVRRASALGGAVAGRVGDHGVVFLLVGSGSAERRRVRAREFAARIAASAHREFGLTLHAGCELTAEHASLDRAYQSALARAESALVHGRSWADVEVTRAAGSDSLWHLRRELARAVEELPEGLAARFERYAEAVGSRTGYRIEPLRIHLDVGFERCAESLVRSGVLDERSAGILRERLDRRTALARTADDVLEAYREAVADLARAASDPVLGRHERGLDHALEYMRQHYTEPLRLPVIARMAGLSSTYFSRLFKQRHGTPFEAYVAALRMARARELLSGTDLGVARVARLAGFGSIQYFCRAFRRNTGRSPLEFRAHGSANKVNRKSIKRQKRRTRSG